MTNPRRSLRACLLASFFIAGFGTGDSGPSALAQAPMHTASLTGTVRNSRHQVLPGVTVSVQKDGAATHDRVAVPLTAVTDSDGSYVVQGLQPGVYSVSVVINGTKRPALVHVTVEGVPTRADIDLRAQGAALQPSLGNHDAFDSTTEAEAPDFTPSGIAGTIAPSGYASGASAEESAQVMANVEQLQVPAAALAFYSGEVFGCEQEPALRKALQAHPESASANHNLGLFYLQHGDPQSGLPLLQLAFTLQPANPEHGFTLGAAQLALGVLPEAIASLQKALALAPADASGHRLLAGAYAASRNPSQAAGEYRAALRLDAGGDNTFRSGLGLLALGQIEAARTAFLAGTVKSPSAARLWLGLGIAQALAQQRPAAIDSLLKASALAPADPAPNSFLASLAGVSPEADGRILSVLERYVRNHPGEAQAHLNYALFLGARPAGEAKASLIAAREQELRAAIRLDPRLEQAQFYLGVLYAQVGDDRAAIAAWQQAVYLEPDDAQAHYRLALALRRENQTGVADREMDTFRRLHGDALRPETAGMQPAWRSFRTLRNQGSAMFPCPLPQ